MSQLTEQINARLDNILKHIDTKPDLYKFYGTIVRTSGFLLEAVGIHAPISTICHIITNTKTIITEIIGFSNGTTYLMSYGDVHGISSGDKIYCMGKSLNVPVGKELLGRILNGLCAPIDNKGMLHTKDFYPLNSTPRNPIERNKITAPLDVGVRAINALLTIGIGQRLGIFAGTGVGKSVLLGMMTRFTKADVVVIGLIGERGREVKEFIEENVGVDNLKKTVIIASPVDASPLERANGALSATAIAEHFRAEGKNVLLIIDSLTRFAQSLRQIYLALGEIPSSKGYSPTVFAKISQLLERAGCGCKNEGSITAFYTILTESDDITDPISDHARSVLDGHIVLSRELANLGHYPAIDISHSISRVMTNIISKEHYLQTQQFKQLYSIYLQNQDLIKMGMYQKGSDKMLDEALQHHPNIMNFLKQDINEACDFKESLEKLTQLKL